MVEQVTKLQPIGLLANTRDYTFVISPELQNWSITNVFEQFANAGFLFAMSVRVIQNL